MSSTSRNSRCPNNSTRRRAKRRIGLGVTGLADALILCGLRYGSPAAVAATEEWLGVIEREAYLASAALAAEKGSFPLFDRDRYLEGETVAALDPEVRDAIARHGIRNALLTSVAPTGTISLFADNVSSGIEPVFSFRHTRNVLMPDGARREEEVEDYAHRLFRRIRGEAAPLPDYFVDAQVLSPDDHLVMQAAAQKTHRQLDFEDDQRPGRHLVRALQGCLPAGLCARLQGLHDLPAERGDGCGARRPARDRGRRRGAPRAAAARTALAATRAGSLAKARRHL